jgi:DNA helicase II / ATP-dependent DNA helicase PcrA
MRAAPDAVRPVEPTPEQLEAVRAGPRGAFLIAAGPGTGKTFTIVERFRWLIEEQGIPPEAVLAVTFTEAAAGELLERLEQKLGRALDEAWIGTFHGICARLLREHAYRVGVPRDAQVLDEIGQRLLTERLRADLRGGLVPGLDRQFDALTPDEVSELASAGILFGLKQKGRGHLPADFRSQALAVHARIWDRGDQGEIAADPIAQSEREAIEILHLVYEAYQQRLARAGRMDFDDLILTVIQALRSAPDFAEACHQRFRAILVDEFQDTNRIQLELVRLLAAPDFANVTVVGDAKQAIYGWRDAEIENIRTRFPGRRLPLTINRRSHQEILDLASDFIHRDPDFRDEPSLTAVRGSGGQSVTVLVATDARAEARRVANEIRRLVEHGRRLSDVAILAYSVRKLPPEFEDELRLQAVPYVTSADSGFFDREEIKDVLALLRLVADPMDDGALVRAMQGPLVRMGDATLYRLALRRILIEDGGRRRRGMRLRDCLAASRSEGWPDVPEPLAARIEELLAVLDRLGQARDALTVGDLLNRLLEETGYLRHCQLRALREGPRGLRNLRKMAELASRFERDSALAGIADFVTHLDQVMEAAVPVGEGETEAPEAVRLLTIHGAKGLEFPVVFVVNLKPPIEREIDKLFFDPERFGFVMKWWRGREHPRYRELRPGAEAATLSRQERRRTYYVAMTRARDLLYVSASKREESANDVDTPVEPGEDDFFAEVLQWARANPEAARVVQADQLQLTGTLEREAAPPADDELPERVADRLELLGSRLAAPPDPAPSAPPRLSFSQLHQFEVCPVRYRFQEVLGVPAPPDQLLPTAARRGTGAAELGSAVHQALALWHVRGGDLLGAYDGPPEGEQLLRAYLSHPLAAATTLGMEVEFNLLLDEGVRVKGLVDRVCELDGRTVLVDYKTNARLDRRLREVYTGQLQLYGLAARRGLLPGDGDPRLILFDLRQAEAIEVGRDDEGAERRVSEIAGRIAADAFQLGPEHDARPCFLCAYRPICPDRRR